MLILILAIYVATGVLLLVGFEAVLTRVTERLGTVVARMQVLANKSLIREPLTREIALARQLAASPLLQSWARDEDNPRLRSQALAELESFRRRLSSGTWFYAIDRTLHYYFNDAQDSHAGKELAYTLDPSRPSDAWYFATRERVTDYALNVSPSEQLDLVKVWVNVVMRDAAGRPLGIVGSGIDLSDFLRRFIDRGDLGVENILVDQELYVQAHPNRKLIDFDSVTRGEQARVRLDSLFGGESLERLQGAVARLAGGQADAEVISLTVDGRRRLVGVAYLPELKWYALTVVDLAKVIERRAFLPLLALAAALLLAFGVLVGWLIDRLVLRRLVPLAASAGRLQQGDYSVRLSPDREDEIGSLTSAFSVMAAAICAHTSTLENEVRKRTETLELQNDALDRKNRELEQTLTHVKRLEGLLPVCSSCKRIRVDPPQPGGLDRWVSL
ncbi:MAG: HAMP domain-containing protein [candidate division NC10 bacterium]